MILVKGRPCCRSPKPGQGLAQEEQARVRQDIILSVYYGFYGLTSALDAKRVAGQNLDRSRDHLRLTRLQKEAGAVPKADVLRAQVGGLQRPVGADPGRKPDTPGPG